MPGDIQITVKKDHEANQGTISGSGSLSFEIFDAIHGSCIVNYDTPDEIAFSFETRAGMKIGKTNLSVELDGGLLSKDWEFTGKAEVELKIPKDIAARISHTFSESGGRTALTVTVNF